MTVLPIKPEHHIGTWEELTQPERDELWQAFQLYAEEYADQPEPHNPQALFFFEAADVLDIDPDKERPRWILLNQRLIAFGEQLVAIAEEQHENTTQVRSVWDEYFPHHEKFEDAAEAMQRKEKIDAEGGCKVISLKGQNT